MCQVDEASNVSGTCHKKNTTQNYPGSLSIILFKTTPMDLA